MILFFDDDARRMGLFLEELEARRLEVKFFAEVDPVVAFVQSRASHGKVRIAILDITAEPGEAFQDLEPDGLLTGVHLYRILREHHPNCFVFILTNVTAKAVEKAIQGDSNALIFNKLETLYTDFVDKVEEQYAKGR